MEVDNHDYSKSLFGGGGTALENRKLLHFWARFIISVAQSITFVCLVALLFFAEIPQASRDLVNILIGAFVGGLNSSLSYFFKTSDLDKDKR
jgi:hypothetical protein|tara:strand:+ start:114 stop:389 length:276 start_codon:yes stop_codon:yes gene_type:complete